MIKLAALGAIGYAGFKYFSKNADRIGRRDAATTPNATAGGPLSGKATVQSTANPPVEG